MHRLHELKEILCGELEEYAEKGKMDVGALDVVDKLAHTIKNLDKIIEKYDEDEYSGNYMAGGAYESRGGRMGGRYSNMYAGARGRGRNARRDAMGRYSSDNEMMITELRELMESAPDHKTREEFEKFIRKMETMG